MATTGVLFGSGTPVTAQSNGSWATATAATGANNSAYAVWTSTASGSNGSIRVEGHGLQAAIGAAPSSIDDVAVTVYANVTGNTSRMASIAVQLTDGGTLIGTPQSMTVSLTTTFSQTFNFSGVTWAQLANLGVRVLFTRAGVTTACTGRVDAVGVDVTYTPDPNAPGVVSSSRSGASDTNSTSNTCPVPSGAAAGMIALLGIEIFLDSGSTPVTPTWPSGFTQIVDERATPTGGVQLLIAKKTLTGADSGNYVTTLPSARWNMSDCVLVENVDTVLTPDASSVKNGSGTSITSLSLTSSAAPVLVHFQANSSAASHTPPTSYTEQQEGDYITVATREPGTTGAHSTSGATQSTSTVWAAALIGVEQSAGGGSPQTVTPTAIASGQALGSVVLSALLAVTPGAITSGQALGTPAVTAATTVAPAAIGTGEALGSPSLSTAGAASPTGIASGEALGAPSVTSSVTVTPGGIATGQAFGSPSVTQSGGVTPTGIPSGQALGSPALSGATTVTPTGVATAGAFGQPTIHVGISVAPVGIAGAAAVGTPSASSTVTLQPTGIASAGGLGAPALTWPVTLVPAGVASTSAVGVPSLTMPSPDDGTPVAHPGLTLTIPASSLTLTSAASGLTLAPPPSGVTLTTPTSGLELAPMSLTVGDTSPALTGACTSDGTPASLTGATVELHISKPDGTVLTKTGEVTDAANGAWRYQWVTGDLDAAGRWLVEAQVTFSSGQVQTFGPSTFRVKEQIA